MALDISEQIGNMAIMAAPREPTLADHMASGRWLTLRCLGCSRERVITMWEAAHRYGHDLTVPEVRALIWARCKASKTCSASIGLALEHETPRLAKGKSAQGGV